MTDPKWRAEAERAKTATAQANIAKHKDFIQGLFEAFGWRDADGPIFETEAEYIAAARALLEQARAEEREACAVFVEHRAKELAGSDEFSRPIILAHDIRARGAAKEKP
jgi:hypothetical protein